VRDGHGSSAAAEVQPLGLAPLGISASAPHRYLPLSPPPVSTPQLLDAPTFRMHTSQGLLCPKGE
jgi:hypothetical protein